MMEAEGRAPERMAAALRGLPEQDPPSRVLVPGLLDGLDAVARRVRALTVRGGADVAARPYLQAYS
ncbi:hypothetical protein ACU4GR_21600 [Methylobacterium oryzae CBMB20]